jgi:histidine triad (HIT) family protein
MSDDCILCKIGSGEVESDVLYRDESCFAVRDIAPIAPVHLLVIPNRHVTRLSDPSAETRSVLGDMLAAASRLAAEEGVGSSGYRLTINQGEDGGQTLEHLHLHVIGGKPLGRMG